MSEAVKIPETVNQVTGVSGAENVIINAPVTINVGDHVHNPVQPAGGVTGQHLELQTQTRFHNLQKSLNGNTETKSRYKITAKFPTLHEPTFQPHPQKVKTNNYHGGGLCTVNTNEFKSSKQISKAEPISHEQFLQEIIQGESKRIAIVGSAGLGKTIELKKLAQLLLENKNQKQDLPSHEQFKIIHWIDLKDLQEEKTTLPELLFDDFDLSESDMDYLLDWIKQNQSDIIFLFDGLDQTRFDTGISYDKIRGLKKKRSVGHLMHNLLSGYFFPDVKIVITSREHSVTELPEEAMPELVIALTGFTQNDAEKLFCEVCDGIDDQAMNNIRQLDMIKIPVYAIFTAVVHKFCDDNVPKYVSGLLAKILEIFTKSTQMRGINVKNIDILHKMMHLSYEGIENKRFTFNVEDLKRHGLDLVDVSDMMSKIPKDNIHPGLLMEGDIVLIFCHQTLQEFLAACYISKMDFNNFKSFTGRDVKRNFDYWEVVIQYLSGILLNSQIEFDKRIHEVADKTTKQEILRNALRERIREQDADADADECLILHESNDDSLIRQVERIYIYYTPLNSNSARAIASIMRRNESMKLILLQQCGLTDELLQIIAQTMKSSRLRVDELYLSEDDLNVTCETLNSFLSNLEVDRLVMVAFPTDFHEEFPIFQNVRILEMRDVTVTNERHRVLFESYKFSGEFSKKEKLLKVDMKGRYLFHAVRVQNICAAEKVQVTAKDGCEARLKDLHAMLDPKWEVDGENMDLEVEIHDSELDVLVTGFSDIREAANRWAVRSLKVKLEVQSRKFLQKFRYEIRGTKIYHLMLQAYGDSYIFSDDDSKITSSIVAQCQVDHLELREIENLKSEHLNSILQNCQLKVLECSQTSCLEEPYFFPLHEFNQILDAARHSVTELRGIQLSPKIKTEDKFYGEEKKSRQQYISEKPPYVRPRRLDSKRYLEDPEGGATCSKKLRETDPASETAETSDNIDTSMEFHSIAEEDEFLSGRIGKRDDDESDPINPSNENAGIHSNIGENANDQEDTSTSPELLSVCDVGVEYSSVSDMKPVSSPEIARDYSTQEHQREPSPANEVRTCLQKLAVASPKLLGTFGQGKIGYDAKKEQEHLSGKKGAISREFVRVRESIKSQMMVPRKITHTIGPDGGTIELFGFKLEFVAGAVHEDREITFSVDNNPDNYPRTISSVAVVPIAPVLGVKPSIQFAKPVNVSVQTWFRSTNGKKISAVLATKKSDLEWRGVGEITLDDSNQVQFSVKNFCQKGICVHEGDIGNGQFTVQNKIFISQDTGLMQSVFYLKDDKNKFDIRNGMLESSYSSFAGVTPRFLCQKYDKIRVEAKLNKPEEKEVEKYIPSAEFVAEELVELFYYEIQMYAPLELSNYNGPVMGDYNVWKNSKQVSTAMLLRKWPIVPDPPVTIIKVDKVNNTVGYLATDNAVVTATHRDSDIRVSNVS